MDNLFAAEALIIERLIAQVPELTTVGSFTLLAGAQDLTPYCPAAFVGPGSGEVLDDTPSGLDPIEGQTYTVLVCVSHIRDPDDVATTATVAGALAAKVIQSLSGWAPGAGSPGVPYKAALRYTGHDDPYYEPGWAEFPLNFRARAVLRGIG